MNVSTFLGVVSNEYHGNLACKYQLGLWFVYAYIIFYYRLYARFIDVSISRKLALISEYFSAKCETIFKAS